MAGYGLELEPGDGKRVVMWSGFGIGRIREVVRGHGPAGRGGLPGSIVVVEWWW